MQNTTAITDFSNKLSKSFKLLECCEIHFELSVRSPIRSLRLSKCRNDETNFCNPISSRSANLSYSQTSLPHSCLLTPLSAFNYSLSGFNYTLSAHNYSLSAFNYSLSGLNYTLSADNYPLSGFNYTLSADNYTLSADNYSLSGCNYTPPCFNYMSLALYGQPLRLPFAQGGENKDRGKPIPYGIIYDFTKSHF